MKTIEETKAYLLVQISDLQMKADKAFEDSKKITDLRIAMGAASVGRKLQDRILLLEEVLEFINAEESKP